MTALVAVIAVLLGVFVAIAPIGPVTVLVVHRVFAGDDRTALRIGLGRIVPEGIYCGLATFGVDALLRGIPGVERGIEITGVVVLGLVGVWLAVQKPKPVGVLASEREEARRKRWGDWSGAVISAINPTPLLSWSAIVAVAIATFELEPSWIEKLLFPVGLGLGIGVGYAVLIAVLRRWRGSAGERVVGGVVRAFGVGFVVLAIACGVRLVVS